MTTLKEKLDAMLLNLEEGSAGLAEIKLIAKALDKAVEQRDFEIDYLEMNGLVSHKRKYKGWSNIELLAILEGAK